MTTSFVQPSANALAERNRVADRAVEIRAPIQWVGFVEHRQAGGGLERVVVIAAHGLGAEVLRHAAERIGDGDAVRHAAGHERIVVERVLAVFVHQCAVNVIKTQIRPVAQEIAQTHVLGAWAVLGVEPQRAAALAREVRGDVRGAGGDAQAVVEMDAVVEAVVEHAGAVGAAQAAAHVDDAHLLAACGSCRLRGLLHRHHLDCARSYALICIH